MTGFRGNEAIGPNAPMVVSETVDGEAIIMHHGTGHYFDTSGSGATIWQVIEATTTRDAIAAALGTTYGLDAAAAQATTTAFLATLAEHDLIKTLPGAAAAVPGTATDKPFSEPVLGVHADLADMLLLDPIHDVDEAGWPAARPHATAA